MRNFRRQLFCDGGAQFIIQHIRFADGDDESFVKKFGVIFFKFVYEYFELIRVIWAICGNEE